MKVISENRIRRNLAVKKARLFLLKNKKKTGGLNSSSSRNKTEDKKTISTAKKVGFIY